MSPVLVKTVYRPWQLQKVMHIRQPCHWTRLTHTTKYSTICAHNLNTQSKKIIAEPKYKYRQQEQLGTTTEVPPWNGQYKNTGGLKPVLRVHNLALNFCYMTGIMNNWNENVKHKTKHLVLRKAAAIEVR